MVVLSTILLAFSLSWLLLLTFYTTTFTGTITSLTHLPNSRGEVCGEEGMNNKGRENLLYFDISRCAGLRSANVTCMSKQVRIFIKVRCPSVSPSELGILTIL